jgi:septal ring factor EnvC (AmiA/AmiB activator)
MLSASGPAQSRGETLDQAVARAKAEQVAAQARADVLGRAVKQAQDRASRLAAEQEAAAQEIETAEARITLADAELRLAAAQADTQRLRLADEQRPAASLLAGLALMASRPPLLTLAGGSSSDELVEVRVLLDSTLPVIRRKSAVLATQLARSEALEQRASAARVDLQRSRAALVDRKQRFAALERKATEAALAAGGSALGASDAALAAGQDIARLRSDAGAERAAQSLGLALAATAPPPPRPLPAQGAAPRISIAYRLPAAADVREGLGAVSDSGVRSRGLTLATARGDALAAPAAGTVRFSGPFQNYDGILIIDHGGGWMSVIVNLSSTLKAGDTVALGAPIGRALGPIEVELSQNGRRVSPALIAGSSAPLSNTYKGG